MKSCVVFRPNPPKLFMLNLNAWIIFELCDGSTSEQIERRYRDNVSTKISARLATQYFEAGLKGLRDMGLIQFSSATH
jgi:hypothetical protein